MKCGPCIGHWTPGISRGVIFVSLQNVLAMLSSEQASTWPCVTERKMWVSSPLHCSDSLSVEQDRTKTQTKDLAEETYAGNLNTALGVERCFVGVTELVQCQEWLFVTLWVPSLKRSRETLGTNLLMFTTQRACFGSRRGEIKNSFSCPGWCRSAG